jgi:LL-H family phage holin
MSQSQLNEVISAAVTLLLALMSLLTALVISYTRKHFAAKDIETATSIVATAVNAIEQAHDSTTSGADKKEAASVAASDLLNKAGVSLSATQLSTMVEGAVGTMNKTPAVIAPVVVTPPTVMPRSTK